MPQRMFTYLLLGTFTPKLGVLLLPLLRLVTSNSAVIVCAQLIDLLIVLFVTSAVWNHTWRKESVLCPSNCRAAVCLVHHSGNGVLRCPGRKEHSVSAVVITSYCITAPHNMSYCGQTEACDSITALHASLSEHADCVMPSSSMVRVVPAILCSAASILVQMIASVILLYIKMHSVSMHMIVCQRWNWMVVKSVYCIW
jgi:hypothetical protein